MGDLLCIYHVLFVFVDLSIKLATLSRKSLDLTEWLVYRLSFQYSYLVSCYLCGLACCVCWGAVRGTQLLYHLGSSPSLDEPPQLHCYVLWLFVWVWCFRQPGVGERVDTICNISRNSKILRNWCSNSKPRTNVNGGMWN